MEAWGSVQVVGQNGEGWRRQQEEMVNVRCSRGPVGEREEVGQDESASMSGRVRHEGASK